MQKFNMNAGMIPYQRNDSSYRGRGRGNSPRGRGRGSNIIIQHGDKKLISMEAGNTGLTNQQNPDKAGSSYSSAVQSTTNKEDEMLLNNSEERVILLLSKYDEKWENNPWYLHKRYLGGLGYTQETYKHRLFYEEILKANNCTIQHFINNANKESYKFSKILIGKIISMTDWGISPFAEKSLIVRNIQMKYNYWDYIQAFDKALLYENETLSHTWFIKLMVNNHDLPVWFIKWWNFHGTSPKILPSPFKELFKEWQQVRPDTQDYIPENMEFFMNFSFPWIWRAAPVTGYTQGFFCLKYRSYSKFWERMLEKDENGELLSAPTIKHIKETISSYSALRIEADKKQKNKEIEATLSLWANESSSDIQNFSEEEIKEAYQKALMETLQKKRNADKASTSDTSMASIHSQTSYSNLLQDAQDPYEDILLHENDEKASKWIQDTTRII